MKTKFRVAIIGTGNIGTDLLIKIMRSEYLTCTLFVGRNKNSNGIDKAKSLGVNVSYDGLNALIQYKDLYDIVADCTSAQSHSTHWRVCSELGKSIIDLTPAKLGKFSVPAIDDETYTQSTIKNTNMITCGGQTSVPIVNAISRVCSVEYVEVASTIASLSAGAATRDNLDEYVETTQQALKLFSGAKEAKAILILNPATPPINMITTIYAKVENPDIELICSSVDKVVESVQQYVPGYELVVRPTVKDNVVFTTVMVRGAGDYLPQYAGNLDIINCAAIAVMEKYVQN